MKHIMAASDIELICQKVGVALTKKRQKILAILLSAKKPLSAYDIIDIYADQHRQPIPAMSVYRILEFLSTSGFIHKLESINQYMLCEHLQCNHKHNNAQFLICDSCHTTEEVVIAKETHQLLLKGVELTGFKLNSLQFELHGTCRLCADSLGI